MSEKRKVRRHAMRKLAVGGKVYVRFGQKKRVAEIIEDRGTIGRGGRRLLRVAFREPNGEFLQVFEIPAADVTTVEAPAKSARSTRAKAHA
jgi:hypothetical protein